MSKKTTNLLRKISTPLLLLPALIITLLFLVAGLVYGIIESLTPKGRLTLDNYTNALEAYSSLIGNTLLMSIGITVLLAVISLPVSYYLAVRVKSDALRLVALLIMLVPFWTDWNIRMVSWYPVLGKTGFLNQVFLWVMSSLGLQNVEYIKFLFSYNGVLITWVQSYILFMIAPIYLVMLRMDPKILNAASTLGANRLKTFYHITLKWSAPGIVIGSVFVFCMSMADYATPQLIGGGIPTIGLVIWLTAARAINFSFAIAISIIIVAITVAIVALMLKISDITRIMY